MKTKKPQFVAHRINSIDALKEVPPEFGIEVDLRPAQPGHLLMAHDPFTEGPDFSEFLKSYNHALLILNIKSEGIEHLAKKIIDEFHISNYMFLDSSVPMIYKMSAKHGEKNMAIRFSQYETMEGLAQFSGKVRWVWADCFDGLPPFDRDTYQKIKSMGYEVCLVSPDLYGRFDQVTEHRHYLKEKNISLDWVCAKMASQKIWTEGSYTDLV